MTSLSAKRFSKKAIQDKLDSKESSNSFWRVAKNNVHLRQQSQLIQRVPEQHSAPLSFNQERVWWAEQTYPGNSIQNLQHQINFTGTLQVDILERSLDEISRRHEILRTTVCEENGHPAQVTAPQLHVELPTKDLQDLDAENQIAEVKKLALSQAEQPFDLKEGSPWRFLLIRLAEKQHILLYTVSHVVFDAWSHGVFMRELARLYEAFVKHQPSPLVELPIQYSDFATAQYQWHQGGTLASHLDYWQKQLAGHIPTLDLPTDYFRPPVPIYQPDCETLTLPQWLTGEVKALSSKQGVSLYVTLLTAFKILLYRYTGQTDLLVNSPVAGRHHSQTRGLIGCFINTLPVRTQLANHSTFKDYLQQVGETSEEVFIHQDVPFRQLTELINLSNTSITGALFILQNVPYPVFELPDLTLSSTYVHRQGGQQQAGNYFDLTLSIHENPDGLVATLAYNATLFNSERIKRMLDQYQTLLESIVANPDGSVASLPILPDSEREQLLVEWHKGQGDYPQDTHIHQWLTAQGEKSQDELQLYILDQSLQPVPIGVVGDVYVGGLKNLSCNPNQIIVHPFNPDLDAYLYKTGDLARYLQDGTLEFWGEGDRQVKIHGFSINIKAIEERLMQHSAVNQAVVLSQSDKLGKQKLVAYIMTENTTELNRKQLFSFLLQTLPNYMVPSVFVTLEVFPTTTEGRIDYHALPAPTEDSQTDTVKSFVAPRIELERQLAKIWSDVLGINQVSMQDNFFFDLGGNSLLAVQVVSQIEKVCGYKMPVVDFFRASTVERLAKRLLSPLLHEEAWSLPWNPLEPVKDNKVTSKNTKAPLFILNGGFNQFLAGAMWIAQRLSKEQPCYSLNMRGTDGREEPLDRIEDMATDAIEGIRSIQPEGPYYLVGLCFGGTVIYEMAQQLRRQGQEVALLFTVESASPIPKELADHYDCSKTPDPNLFDERTRSNPTLLRVAEGIYKAAAAYEAEPYPGKSIVCQATEGDEQEEYDRKCYLATWQRLCGEVEFYVLPGGHISLYAPENIGALIDTLKQCLAEAVESIATRQSQ